MLVTNDDELAEKAFLLRTRLKAQILSQIHWRQFPFRYSRHLVEVKLSQYNVCHCQTEENAAYYTEKLRFRR
jgi:hypothetical protein